MQTPNDSNEGKTSEVVSPEASQLTDKVAELSSTPDVGRRGAFKRLVGYTAPAMLALLLAPDTAAAT